MTTINLYQNNGEREKRAVSQGANSGFFFSLGILVITLLVLFGLKFYNPILIEKNEALALNIGEENKKLVGLKDLEQIVDMQSRLGLIKVNLAIDENGTVKRTEMMQLLDKLSSDINKGVVISEYNYNDNKVKVNFSAGNFDDASKQIFNLKQSKYFTNVNLLTISRGENSVLFEIEMEING